MLLKLLLKRILPSLIVLALLILGGLWLYGYAGVKCGWVGVTDIHNLNAVSRSGADAAGGVTAAAKSKLGL